MVGLWTPYRKTIPWIACMKTKTDQDKNHNCHSKGPDWEILLPFSRCKLKYFYSLQLLGLQLLILEDWVCSVCLKFLLMERIKKKTESWFTVHFNSEAILDNWNNKNSCYRNFPLLRERDWTFGIQNTCARNSLDMCLLSPHWTQFRWIQIHFSQLPLMVITQAGLWVKSQAGGQARVVYCHNGWGMISL